MFPLVLCLHPSTSARFVVELRLLSGFGDVFELSLPGQVARVPTLDRLGTSPPIRGTLTSTSNPSRGPLGVATVKLATRAGETGVLLLRAPATPAAIALPSVSLDVVATIKILAAGETVRSHIQPMNNQ
jgi:hypothetical protein